MGLQLECQRSATSGLGEGRRLAANRLGFRGTVAAVERELRRGDHVFRYVETDDFEAPENACKVCTFWYIDAIAALGRRDEVRRLFEKRSPHATRWASCRKTATPMTNRIVIVSNRVVPVNEGKNAAGGLAVAVLAALPRSGGVWDFQHGRRAESRRRWRSLAGPTFVPATASRRPSDSRHGRL